MSKESELKERLTAVLTDIKREGGNDPEAIWTIGSLAATLVDKVKAGSWAEFKASMTQGIYEDLLKDFQAQGNALYQAGDVRKAYAIQALGLSVVCRTQRGDPQLRDGETLLDAMIEGAIGLYRRTRTVN